MKQTQDNYMFAQTGYPPLLVVDFRVICWGIYPLSETVASMLRIPNPPELKKMQNLPQAKHKDFMASLGLPMELNGHSVEQRLETWQTWVKAAFAMYVHRGPDMLPRTNYTICVVDDNGGDVPYWRKTELPKYFAKHRPEDAEEWGYKAGRNAKPDRWGSVAQIGISYFTDPKSGIGYFTEPGYEADDWAGAIVGLKRLFQSSPDVGPHEVLRDREVYLQTVDTDWLQLAGQGVWWCNTGPWQPRLRGEDEAIAYIIKKSKKSTHKRLPGGKVQYAHQIVDIKMIEGDSSDNLPPGSPRWAIDLINSHSKFSLRNHPRFKDCLPAISSREPNTRHDHYQKASDWIASQGLPAPVQRESFVQEVF